MATSDPTDSDHGFSVQDAIFSPDEMMRVLSDLGTTATGSRAGARHLMSHPTVVQVAKDRRLMEIARHWVGPGAVPYRATLFDKSSLTNWLVMWHQDTALPLVARRDVAGWGPWSVKEGIQYAHAPASTLERVIALRVHLDDSHADNGPLRVVPGSHTRGVLSDNEIGAVVSSTAGRPCLARCGGVIAMRPLLVHASSKCVGKDPRRVLHIEYASSLQLEGELELTIA